MDNIYRINILLLDNQKTAEIKYLKELLDQNSYYAQIIPEEKSLYEAITIENPKILIMDLSGRADEIYKICSNIKNDPVWNGISVILLSENYDSPNIIKGLQCKADSIIFKPYNNKLLLTRIQAILMNMEQRNQNPAVQTGFFFQGQNYFIDSNRVQMIDLLLSILENFYTKIDEQDYVLNRLMFALDNIRNLDELKNDFISSVSHEIRTPLTSISGALRLIQGGVAGPVSDQVKHLVNIASRNSERLMLLINDILDIQKIESGQMRFQFKHIKVVQIVKQAIEENSVLAEKHDVAVTLENSEIDCYINVDPNRLIQVLTNLLSNATKFSPQYSEVKVRIDINNLIVRISVIDQGPGIPDNFRATIFDKFTQLITPRVKSQEGTGLGLNIARTLIMQLNGNIDFESIPGKGSIFFIELPRIIL